MRRRIWTPTAFTNPSISRLQKLSIVYIFRAALGAFAYFEGLVRPVSVRNDKLARNSPDYAYNEPVKSIITVLACEVEIR